MHNFDKAYTSNMTLKQCCRQAFMLEVITFASGRGGKYAYFLHIPK